MLMDLLDAAARMHPQRTALVCDGERLSFETLNARMLQYASGLIGCGVREGDRVVLLMDNSVAMVAWLFAVLRAGAICVPLNPQVKADKLGVILGSCRPTALLGHASLATTWRGALAGSSVECQVLVIGECALLDPGERSWEALPTGRDAPAHAARDPQQPAFISHTSGTTGIPKGVVLSHHSLATITATITGYLGITESDVIFSALPLSFNYGLTQLLVACAAGATLVLERSFTFPVRILQTMAREGATVFPAVPTMYAMLAPLNDFRSAALPSLRLMTSASAPLDPGLGASIRARFPDAPLCEMYGQTECTRISYMPPAQYSQRPGSVGQGLPGQCWWLRDEAGRRLPHGSSGELVVQGDHVMLGYWQDPDATRQKIALDPTTGERVLFTGDLFRSDEVGWLYFVERMDDIIMTRGEKVSPREVERVLQRLPGVAECMVVGVDDPLLGQAVRAYVACMPDVVLEERQVIRHCLSQLESYMAPKSVGFVDALPRTYNGKVRRQPLP